MSSINSKIRSLFVLILAVMATIALVGCDNKDTKILNEIQETFLIGDLSGVKVDFDLPKFAKRGENIATVTWESNNPEVIEIVEHEETSGKADEYYLAKVTRQEDEDVTVTLTATLKHGKKTLDKKFTAKVISIDTGTPIAQVKNGVVGNTYTITGVVIYATDNGFFVGNDEAIYIFGSGHGRTTGEHVEVTGTFDIFFDMPQLKNANVRVLGEKEFDLSEMAINATVSQVVSYSTKDTDSYAKVIRLEAMIQKSGNYYDITDGNVKVSLHNDSLGRAELDAYFGKEVELLIIILDYHSTVNLWRVLYVPGTVKEAAPLTDQEKVDRAITSLEETISGDVYGKIDLPTSDSRYPGLTITWTSSDTSVLSNDGVAADVTKDTKVNLTATVKSGEVTKTITIEVTVKESKVLSVTAARQLFTYDDNTVFMWFKGIVIGFDNYGYFVADNNTSIYVRDNKSTVNIGDELEVQGTGKMYFGNGKTAADFTQVTVQVDGAIEGFKVDKLSSDNPIPLSPVTKNITDFTNVPKTIEGTKNADFYGKLVKISGKLITAQSGNFVNTYIQDDQGNKVIIYHNSVNDALTTLNAALGLDVTVTLMPIDQSKFDGWRMVFFNNPGDLVINATKEQKIDMMKDEIATIIKDGDNITSDLNFKKTSSYTIFSPTPRFEWTTNNAALDANGKVTRGAEDITVQVTVKVFLGDETTAAATVTMTVTVKQQGASVWTTETFDTFPEISNSYKTKGDFVGVSGVKWEYQGLRGDLEGYVIDGKGLMFGNREGHKDGQSILKATINGGIGDFKVDTLKAFTGTSVRSLELYINGQLKQSFTLNDLSSVQVFEVSGINVSGTFTLELRLVSTSSTNRQQITVDNLSWTNFD